MRYKIAWGIVFAAIILGGCGGGTDFTAQKEQTDAEQEQAIRKPGQELETKDTVASESGAGGDVNVAESSKEDGHKTVGISMPSQILQRWNNDGHFLQKHFEEAGYTVILSYANDLIDGQMDDVESMIEQGADLLIIAPIDASSLTKQIEEAEKEGIPVISYDRLMLNSPYVDYYVSFDNYQVGVMQGEYIRDALDLEEDDRKKYNIEFVSGDIADNNAYFYYDGAMSVLDPYLQSGKLTIRSRQKSFFDTSISSWSTALSRERFEGILNSYYSKENPLHAVCCANDSTALGVSQAIANNSVMKREVIVTGQDGDSVNLKNIMEGRQSMTVFKVISNESQVTLELGIQILNGKRPAEDLIENANWGFECIYDTESYDNGQKVVPSYLLEPFVVTKQNLQAELLDTGYYSVDKKGNFHAEN